MADAATLAIPQVQVPAGSSLRRFARRRSSIAFLMTLPLLAIIGGLVAWLLGLLADQTSLTTVMIVIAALPLPGFLISLALPGENEAGQPSEEPARV